MAKKKKQTPTEETTQEKEVRTFSQADLVVECSCGHVQVLDTNISGGLQMIMPTDDAHAIRLVCKKCGANLTLKFVEAANPAPESAEPEEAPQLEDVSEEDIPEVIEDSDESQGKEDMEVDLEVPDEYQYGAETIDETKIIEDEPEETSE